MSRYYIMAVDSYVNTFSMADTTAAVRFRLANPENTLTGDRFAQDDQILVYKRHPHGEVNIWLEAQGEGYLWKKYEVWDGVSLSGHDIGKDPEQEDVIQISPGVFRKIVREMLSVDLEEVCPPEEAHQEREQRVTGGENILLYGVPGSGKSHTIRKEYCSDAERMERVVFHPDYSYSDFVGQILPRVEKEQLKYVFTPGPFTKILKKAWDNPGKKWYLVIEEINRGNAPAIFGEMFQLLDRKDVADGAYGESEYGITHFEVAQKVFGREEEPVKIPSNLWILATMNTADQNVFTLDTAFQRRWKMRHIRNHVMGAAHAGQKIEGSIVSWGIFASAVNDLIVDYSADMVSSEDKRLGAYFVRPEELSAGQFPEKVLKYLWDDVFKMDRTAVFDEKFKSLESVLEAYGRTEGDRLRAVLKEELYGKMAYPGGGAGENG